MRKIVEIQNDLRAAIDEVKRLDPATDEGQKAQANVKKYMDELAKAREIEAAERALVDEKLAKEAKRGHEFSLRRFINGAVTGRMDGLEKEMADAGRAEHERLGFGVQGYVIPTSALRAASGLAAGSAGAGAELVGTNQHYIEALREHLSVVRMGATMLTDLVGNVDLPSIGSVSAAFLAEGAVATASKPKTAKVTLTPRGIRTFIPVTRDLLKQTSLDVENILKTRLVEAESACVDKEALAAIVAGATQAGTAFDWANTVKMETTVNKANANRGALGYILPADDWGLAKTTQRGTTNRFILDDNGTINGYAADYSNQFAANTPIFGNFNDLYIGRWGGLDLLVDPFTLSNTGEIKLTIFSYADAKVGIKESFSKLTIA